MNEQRRPAVGQRTLRREDRPLLQGQGKYLDDLPDSDVLHARFVRSSFAHAEVHAISTAEACAAEGVADVFTSTDLDLPPLLPPIDTPGAVPVPRPILAHDRIRFMGEAYALVVADDPYLAEDAAELIELEAEPLPVVADTERAVSADAPRVHDHHSSNVLFEKQFESEGFVEDGDVVVTRTLRSPRQTALPIEPRGILVRPTQTGIEVWASTQSPHMLAGTLAEMLDLPVTDVRVIVPDIGGGFGVKAHVYPEEIAVAAAARRLGRPVKWVEDRVDNLSSSCHARDQRINITVSADAGGRLRSIDADFVSDMGAYGVYAHGHLLEPAGTPGMIPGPYRLPSYRYRTRAVATNKCPLGAYRGVGLPVATFVHERAMDFVADATGIDRAEVRRRNLIPAEEMPYTSLTGQVYDTADFPQVLETALEAVGYHGFAEEQQRAAQRGRLLGLGMAVYIEHTAVNSATFAARGMRGLAGYDEAYAELDRDGHLHLWTTLPTMGQGLTTTFAQLAADDLGIPFDDVTVERVDTGVGPLSGNGTFASRSAVSGGGAIKEACEELRTRLVDDAAELLESAPGDLEISDGTVRVIGAPHTAVSFAEIVAATDAERYRLSRRHDPPAVVYPYGVHACRVEIDPVTGHIDVSKYVVVEDSGKVINPMIALGQVHGAVTQGLAGALYESLTYDEGGQLQTASLMDYLAPTATEVMPIEVHHMHVPGVASVTGAKGVGESGTLAPGPAIAGAISDALGVECNQLPPEPGWVREAAVKHLARSAEGGGRLDGAGLYV